MFRLVSSRWASAGDGWCSSSVNVSLALDRFPRMSLISKVGTWFMSSVSICVLSVVQLSRIFSRKSRCLNTRCWSSVNFFCILMSSDRMSLWMFSLASFKPFTVWFRWSSVLAQARQTSTLHLRHHKLFGIACVKQFSFERILLVKLFDMLVGENWFLSGWMIFFVFMLIMFCERYRMALYVGRLSGFISGCGSSVRFQQWMQYSSLPFSRIVLIHLRQK